MVFWAGNFIVVKGAIGVLPPVGFTFLRYCIAAITLLLLLRWREGAIRLPRGDIAPDLRARDRRVRLLPDPVAGRAPDDPGRRLRAAHRRDPGHHRAAGDGDRGGHAERGQARRRVRLVRRASRSSSRAGQGLSLGVSLVGDVLTLIAAACWADLHGLRRDDPAPPLAAGHDDLGDRRRDAVHRAARDRPARHADLSGGLSTSGCRSSSRSSTRGRWPPASRTSIVLHGVKLLGPTRVNALQFLVPALAVVMAAIFLGETDPAGSSSSVAPSSWPASRCCGAARGRAAGRSGRSASGAVSRPR